MSKKLCADLIEKSNAEPFASLLGMEAVEVAPGFARVRMKRREQLMNLFGATHGGALFSLIDEAFQLACNSHGALSVALNVNITYVARADPDATLEATASERHITNRTSSYQCEVRELNSDKLVATAQALAYRTGKQVSDMLT